MKTEDIENVTDQEYAEAMTEMVKKLLINVSGHDALFSMQALMGALANIIIDTAPSVKEAVNAIMGLSITTIHGVESAFEMMEDAERLDGEEDATHETPFRVQ